MTTTINDFSLLCRLFGNLFYRKPNDPILAGTFAWLAQSNLRQHWALSTDSQSEQALDCVQKQATPAELAPQFHALFAENGAISTACSAYGLPLESWLAFRQAHTLPEVENADHVALLLLSASWLEDHNAPTAAQQQLFEQFLLPCLSKFLGKVEAFDTGFYQALARLTRDALSAMADELEEADELAPTT